MLSYERQKELLERQAKEERLRKAAPQLLAACEAIEWVWVQGSVVECCPWCNATRLFGHKDDCIRQAAIASAKSPEKAESEAE